MLKKKKILNKYTHIMIESHFFSVNIKLILFNSVVCFIILQPPRIIMYTEKFTQSVNWH